MKNSNHNTKQQLKRGQFPLPVDDVQKIIDNADSLRDRLIIQLMAFCGLRRAEVALLEVDQVDIETKRITVTGKRRKTRIVPIPSFIVSDLAIYLKGIRRKWVFPARSKRGALVPSRINGIVSAAARRAGVKNPCPGLKHINPHSLRHTYARELKKKNVPLEAVQGVLGHKDLSTTMNVYGLMTAEEVLENVAAAIE